MNLVQVIKKHIETDTDYKTRYDNRIIKTYTNATDLQKELIDDIFIDLTGYSLKTIIKQSKEQNER